MKEVHEAHAFVDIWENATTGLRDRDREVMPVTPFAVEDQKWELDMQSIVIISFLMLTKTKKICVYNYNTITIYI